MNKFQKRFNRELRDFIRDHKYTKCLYKRATRYLRFKMKYDWCSPCEDCNNINCDNDTGVMVYCSKNR